jgi:hypothetical protein
VPPADTFASEGASPAREVVEPRHRLLAFASERGGGAASSTARVRQRERVTHRVCQRVGGPRHPSCLPAREVVEPRHRLLAFASERGGGAASSTARVCQRGRWWWGRVIACLRFSMRGGRAASPRLRLVTAFPTALVSWSCLVIN